MFIDFLPYIISQFRNPLAIFYLIVGNIIGIIFGAIPGLNGTFAVLMFMPLTYTMETGMAVILLMSLWIGGCSGGFIGSVLLGIPGSPASVATCFDGYPMSRKGETGKALAIGMLASFIGTFFSAVAGALLSNSIAKLAFSIGVWEYTGLCLLAITMVLAVSKGNMLKGLAAASIGFFMSTVGYSPVDSVERFTFGNMHLISGLSTSTVLIGLFGMTLIIVEFGKGFQKIPDIESGNIKGLGLSLQEIVSHGVNIVRSFLIGLFIGFLPGLGSALSNLVAYSSAKAASKHPETFGTGEPDGVWASEVSNNAAIGGAMIPMAALGIPGDSTTALLIGALTIHGLEMGPMVFKNSGQIVYMMFTAVALCAIVCFAAQRLGMRWFPKILKIPYHYLYPAIIMVSITGAFMDTGSMYSCGIMLVFTVVGIVMSYGGLPTSPLILSFVLGKTLESNMLKAFQYTGTVTTFFTRPLSCVLMILTILSVLSPVIRFIIQKMKECK